MLWKQRAEKRQGKTLTEEATVQQGSGGEPKQRSRNRSRQGLRLGLTRAAAPERMAHRICVVEVAGGDEARDPEIAAGKGCGWGRRGLRRRREWLTIRNRSQQGLRLGPARAAVVTGEGCGSDRWRVEPKSEATARVLPRRG
ncbi:hypothetical protein B296_00058859 [Ensete ventricosum]|uniref:Uncharacterized protein n=1 Tax=Ensete ventricosum TaxID=4639 RepID=A0A426X6H8_ENSVE|nr:hypothetical protein B296_00058859 [Ensete ventricosum]